MINNENGYYLTVGQLKQRLEEFDDNLVIVLSSDDEGNSYRPAYGDAPYGYHFEQYGHELELVEDEETGEWVEEPVNAVVLA